jgi:hypothetical protein
MISKKKRKGYDGGGPPIALEAPKLEGHRRKNPTSFYMNEGLKIFAKKLLFLIF